MLSVDTTPTGSYHNHNGLCKYANSLNDLKAALLLYTSLLMGK